MPHHTSPRPIGYENEIKEYSNRRLASLFIDGWWNWLTQLFFYAWMKNIRELETLRKVDSIFYFPPFFLFGRGQNAGFLLAFAKRKRIVRVVRHATPFSEDDGRLSTRWIEQTTQFVTLCALFLPGLATRQKTRTKIEKCPYSHTCTAWCQELIGVPFNKLYGSDGARCIYSSNCHMVTRTKRERAFNLFG